MEGQKTGKARSYILRQKMLVLFFTILGVIKKNMNLNDLTYVFTCYFSSDSMLLIFVTS